MPRGFSPLITLTTDFGNRDGFVGAMKGVIYSINPNAKIVDLTHDIPPQDVLAGAMVVRNTCPYFPEGTIHVVVVDPGVGTDRNPIVATTAKGTFVLPDNGLLTLLHRFQPVQSVTVIENPEYMLDQVSNTFHGRDIFAPTAAYLSLGRSRKDIGPDTGELNCLDIAEPEQYDGFLHGEIIYRDIFGNLTTNIEAQFIAELGETFVLEANGVGLRGPRPTYGDVPKGEPLCTVGGSGFLEIAVNGGNAAEQLALDVGDRLKLKPGF